MTQTCRPQMPQDKIAADMLAAFADGRLAVHDISATDERRMRAVARQSVLDRQGRIAAKVGRNSHRAARRAAEELRRSLAGRFTALTTKVPDHLRQSAQIRYATNDDLRSVRLGVVRAALGEVGNLDVPAHAILQTRAKRNSGLMGKQQYRPIFEYDWLDQARNRLLALSLQPFADFHPSQYLLRQADAGCGRSGVCEALLRLLPVLNEEHVFIQMDVTNFFGTISHRWLEDVLPVPKAKIRARVHTGGMTFVPMGKTVKARLQGGAISNLSQQGIPTGSALSPLVGEWVIAEVLTRLIHSRGSEGWREWHKPLI